MCLGIPGQIVEFLDEGRQTAKVDVSGVRRNVHVGLVSLDGVDIGDWVLIHVGFAISKIDEAEARATYELLQGMADALDQELEEWQHSDPT
jgi:hydrogenase expression/formation protein HypC